RRAARGRGARSVRALSRAARGAGAGARVWQAHPSSQRPWRRRAARQARGHQALRTARAGGLARRLSAHAAPRRRAHVLDAADDAPVGRLMLYDVLPSMTDPIVIAIVVAAFALGSIPF